MDNPDEVSGNGLVSGLLVDTIPFPRPHSVGVSLYGNDLATGVSDNDTNVAEIVYHDVSSLGFVFVGKDKSSVWAFFSPL